MSKRVQYNQFINQTNIKIKNNLGIFNIFFNLTLSTQHTEDMLRHASGPVQYQFRYIHT